MFVDLQYFLLKRKKKFMSRVMLEIKPELEHEDMQGESAQKECIGKDVDLRLFSPYILNEINLKES